MDTITKLRQLAGQIDQRRVELDLSKNQLCAKYGQLGSTKTFGRILKDDDDLDGMDIEKQVQNYGAALELLAAYAEDPEENKIYADFSFVREAMQSVAEAMQQTDNTRLVLVTSRSGGGKTTFKEALKLNPRFRNNLYDVEATEAWRSKTNGLLGALLEAVLINRAKADEKEESSRASLVKSIQGTEARLIKLIERINGSKIILVIDEAHHLGPEGFNLVKTIINQTRAVVILLAHPDLLNRINRNSYAETSQLWQNRLYECIKLPAPVSGDVMEFLKRRGVKFASEKVVSEASASISKESDTHGLWKFVKRCAQQARKNGAGALSSEDFARVIVKVKARISLV